MILQALDALYGRIEANRAYELAPARFSYQKITFKIVLRPDGGLFDIQDARVEEGGKLRSRRVQVLGATKPSGSALNPCFLWDNGSYLLGFATDEEKPGRAAAAFAAFKQRHLSVQGAIGSAPFDAVCAFLAAWDPAHTSTFPVLNEAAKMGFGVFQIVGQPAWVHDDPRIVEWWKSEMENTDEVEVVGQCLVTGQRAPLARLHEKIKGIAGGQGAGAPIVGFNSDAFESFGKEQSYNAPVSQQAAFRYGSALNALLDGPMREKHRLTLGDMTIAFWTERPTATEDIFARFAAEGSAVLDDPGSQDEPTRAKLQAFLNALRMGREAYGELETDPVATPFFVLGLSPNAGRVSVRFFHRSSLAELLDNLRRHHRDIGLTPQAASGKRQADPEFPPTWLLLRQTAREGKDIPPLLAGPLLRAILTGTKYPQGLFTAVVRRIRADQAVTYPRVSVLKGYLNRNMNLEVSMSLDTERPDPAYRLGRLFAALEKTQRDALGERLNTTIRDSFYGSASATPATVFPRLLRVYQHHLAKLEGGRRVHREKLVQEILDPLSGFPAHLGLDDQGLFAIGYYHQTRDFYTKRTESNAN